MTNLISSNMKTKYTKYDIHPAADIYPLLDDNDLADLAQDIKANGLKEPIKLYENKIIDGRNRLRACLMAGVEPDFITVEADDPFQYSVSLNTYRRHLTSSQRAFVAAQIYKAQKCSQYDAASAMNISVATLSNALAMEGKAVPELIKAVREGRISVSLARKISEKDKATQRELAALGKVECKKKWYALRKAEKTNEPERTVSIAFGFSEDEIKMIDKWRKKRMDGISREDFIRQAVIESVETFQYQEAVLYAGKNMFKDESTYNDAQLRVDASGMSEFERDEAEKADIMADPSMYQRRFYGLVRKKLRKVKNIKV